MAAGPQPSFNFHARIDRDTEERRRRLQAQTGLPAPGLVREAFRELERRLNACRRKVAVPLPKREPPSLHQRESTS
jgi:hypothetical protein